MALILDGNGLIQGLDAGGLPSGSVNADSLASTLDLSSKTMTFGNVSASGITFPATQSASGNANTLDDYEEGTWTPIFISASGAFDSVTYSANRVGKYVKIGQVVYITCSFYTTAISVGTASGAVRIGGLPFTSVNNADFGFALKGDIRDFTGEEPFGAQVDAGSTYIGLYFRSNVTGDGAESQVSDLATSGNSNVVGMAGFYFV